MSQDPNKSTSSDRNSASPASGTDGAVFEKTSPGPENDPRAVTDNRSDFGVASPADDVARSDDPDSGAARAALAAVADPSVPVVEPAHDQTGMQVIDPRWVYTGYWGPLDENQHPAVVALRNSFGDAVTGVRFFRDEVTVLVEAQRIAEMLTFLRDNQRLSYRILSDLTAVDMLRLRTSPRFDVVYQLYSVKNRQRLRLKAALEDGRSIPTVTSVYAVAGWLERECYDMFGIVFEGHPDLRRMLLPEDWDEGHPLRKDYPIRGFKQYVQPGFDAPTPRIRTDGGV